MKTKKIFAFLSIFILVLSGCNISGQDDQIEDVIPNYDNTIYEQVIIHAMGRINGEDYLNCLDCFYYHHDRGAKYFEIDLRYSTDGKLIASHMFENTPDGENMTYEEFKQLKVGAGNYGVITYETMITMLEQKKDFFFIIDTKLSDEVSVIESLVGEFLSLDKGHLLKRVLPYIYDIEQYAQMEALYNFTEYVYTPYKNYTPLTATDTKEEIIEFLATTPKIKKVVVNADFKSITGYDAEFFNQVTSIVRSYENGSSQTNLKLYFFTINDKSDALDVISDYSATGIVTDIANVNLFRDWIS